MSKLNIAPIVADHWETLRNMGTERLSRLDVFTFGVVPLALAGLLLVFGIRLSTESIVVLITALSIFAGLLLNLLLLTHGMIAGKAVGAPTTRRRLLLKELYRNISYAVLLALIAVAVLVLAALLSHSVVQWIASAVVYLLVAHFLLTLLMILKRVHVMLSKEYDL